MNERTLPGLQVLSGYFSEALSHHLSCSGCNDMPQEIFFCLSPDQKSALHVDFLEWDKVANPSGWEPTPLDLISDISWAGYFMERTFAAICGGAA